MDYAALAKQFGGTTATPAASSARTAAPATPVAPQVNSGNQNQPSGGQNQPSEAQNTSKVDYSALAAQYGGKTIPKPVGFIQGAIRAIASPFLRAGANVASLADLNNPTELAKDQSQGVSYGDYLGSYRPIGSPLDANGKPVSFGKQVVDTLGTGVEAAANFIGGGEAADVAKAGIQGGIKQAIIKGAKIGTATGALAGGGSAAQAPDASVGSVVSNTVVGGVLGAPLGAAAEAAGPIIGASKGYVDNFAENKAAKIAASTDKLAGAIAQGNAEDINAVKNTIKQVDLTGAKTYKDAAAIVDNHISNVAQGLDRVLETNPAQVKLPDLSIKVSGEDHNYVEDAMTQLNDLYSKTNNVRGQSEIAQLRQKAMTTGLTTKDVNDLARLHGEDLSGFNANGELASGLTKQAKENTRVGLKATGRNMFGNKIYDHADSVMTDLIKTRGLFQDMAGKVQTAQQKMAEKSLPQKAIGLVEKAVNLGTLGTSRGALKTLAEGAGIKGTETMSTLDIQKALQKNIEKLDSIIGSGSKGEMVSNLDKFIADTKESSGKRLALPAPSGQSGSSPIYVTPAGKASTVAQEASDVAAVEQGRAKTDQGKINPSIKLPVKSMTNGGKVQINDGNNYYGQKMGEIQMGNVPKEKIDQSIPVIKSKDLTAPKVATRLPKPTKQGGYVSLKTLAAGGLGTAGLATAASIPNKETVTNPKQGTQPATNFDPQDKNILAATVFGELSNKGDTAAEARKIINTVVNRTKQTGGSIRDVITAPRQYQAYGKQQFMNAIQGKLDPLSQKKMAVVNAAVDELYSGKLQDNTNGSVFYQHDKNGNLKLEPGKLKK